MIARTGGPTIDALAACARQNLARADVPRGVHEAAYPVELHSQGADRPEIEVPIRAVACTVQGHPSRDANVRVRRGHEGPPEACAAAGARALPRFDGYSQRVVCRQRECVGIATKPLPGPGEPWAGAS